ncbi:MAG TPA: hypothetical protein VNO30_14085 [Kofleriaceae bacterium]|nr:hypothetical protein [Kofleriaceae bacterium]
MGMFTLSREVPPTAADGTSSLPARSREVVISREVPSAAADGTFSHAFGAPLQRSAAGYTLRLFGKLNGRPAGLLDRGDGDFIAQTGTFYFGGKTGTQALEALFERFDGKRFPWAECRGHFAVILRWRRRLFLATDALGAYKVYHDREQGCFSSSFLAVQAALPRVTIDKQGCYEYAWNGTTFGDKTFFHEVRMLRQGMLIELTDRPTVLDTWRLAPAARSTASFEDTAQLHAARLRDLVRTYAAGGGPFRLGMSGGYDSRLILALLLDAGSRPELFVYGPRTSPDVDLALRVASSEGLAIEHIDKSQYASALDPVHRLQRAHDGIDGWNGYGVLNNGADAEDRLARVAGDQILLNGSCGEIFRNFFNLPDRPYQLSHIVPVFYSYLLPRACTPAFDVHEYESGLVADMQSAISTGGRWKTREEIEALYPLHRGRYWTARDIAVNNRFGRVLFPFLEAAIVEGTAAIPVAFKQYGRLQARMIEILRPSLARSPTTRGFCPADRVPLRYKLLSQANIQRPTWIRPYGYRLRHRHPIIRPEYLRDEALRHVIDPELPVMQAYFHPEQIHDGEVLNRVCTMEWLSSSPARATFERYQAAS